jgi:hypothetical protein
MDVRAAIRTLWLDTCSIVEYQPVQEANKSTNHIPVTVMEDIQCKLSFSKSDVKTVDQSDTVANINTAATLFIDEKLNIKAGSKIIVKQHTGREFEFKQSGASGVFTNHQEIPLVLYEDYA